MATSPSTKANMALKAHMHEYPGGQLLRAGTFASTEFDRLYTNWIRTRWDEQDPWVLSVWEKRP